MFLQFWEHVFREANALLEELKGTFFPAEHKISNQDGDHRPLPDDPEWRNRKHLSLKEIQDRLEACISIACVLNILRSPGWSYDEAATNIIE